MMIWERRDDISLHNVFRSSLHGIKILFTSNNCHRPLCSIIVHSKIKKKFITICRNAIVVLFDYGEDWAVDPGNCFPFINKSFQRFIRFLQRHLPVMLDMVLAARDDAVEFWVRLRLFLLPVASDMRLWDSNFSLK